MAAPSPNTPMVTQQLYDLINLAQSKASILHGPFYLADTRQPEIVNWKPPYVVKDRGGYDPTVTYQVGDQAAFTSPVTGLTYEFVNVQGNTKGIDPLDQNGNPNPTWYQLWPQCYQRLRDEVSAAANGNGPRLATHQQSVSGPWPITTPDIHYNDLAFYYPDTGKQESVTVQGTISSNNEFEATAVAVTYADADSAIQLGSSTDGTTGFALLHIGNSPLIELVSDTTNGGTQSGQVVMQAITLVDPNNGDGQYRIRFVSSATLEVVVGGSGPVPISAVLSLGCGAIRGFTNTITGNGTEDGGTTTNLAFSDVDPASLITVDASNWIPGASLVTTTGAWQNMNLNGGPQQPGVDLPISGGVDFSWTINGMVPPGTYRVTLSTSSSPNNQASGQLTDNFTTDGINNHDTYTGMMSWSNDTYVSIGTGLTSRNLTIEFVATQTSEVPGIHDTKKVMKIPVSSYPPGGAPPTVLEAIGIFRYDMNGDDSTQPPFNESSEGGFEAQDGPLSLPRSLWNNPPPTDPVYEWTIYGDTLSWSITASTIGYWFAKTPPIQSLGILPFERMPWNQFPIDTTKSPARALLNPALGYIAPYIGGPGTGFDATPAYNFSDAPGWIAGTNNIEMLPCPKPWKPGVTFPKGFVIVDSNGNFQIANAPGKSGNTAPTWQTKKGAVTADGSSMAWKCVKVNAIFNAPVARITPPIYPVYKSTDTPPVLKFGYTDNNLNPIYDFGFTPGGPTSIKPPSGSFAGPDWWIYRVALNRVPQIKTTQPPPTDPISVTIGCIRNGAFTAFGTFQTGQIIDAMWPVFIAEALVYQASELVDVQAEFITCGANYAMWGQVGYPMAAAHINDLTAILGLLV